MPKRKRTGRKPDEARSPLRYREIRTCSEVAEMLGLTRQRVQQIESEALIKLRRGLKAVYENYCHD